MTVADSGKRVSPGDLLRAQEIAQAQRIIERRQRNKRAREWAEERAKVALQPDDPAFWFVMEKLRDDQEFGYKIREPWCFEGRLKIHLAKFHAISEREAGQTVYYIRVGKYIKIGTSTDVDKRLKSYPPGAKLLATEPELMTHIKNLQRHARDELRAARAKG